MPFGAGENAMIMQQISRTRGRFGKIHARHVRHALLAASAALAASLATNARAQISVGGSAVTENFNSIGSSGTASLPANWKVDKLSVVRTEGTFSGAVTATD